MLTVAAGRNRRLLASAFRLAYPLTILRLLYLLLSTHLGL